MGQCWGCRKIKQQSLIGKEDFLLSFLRYMRTRISPHVGKSGFRNARIFCVWNSESENFLLLGSRILGLGIRNTAQGVRNPTNHLESEIQYLLSRIHGIESRYPRLSYLIMPCVVADSMSINQHINFDFLLTRRAFNTLPAMSFQTTFAPHRCLRSAEEASFLLATLYHSCSPLTECAMMLQQNLERTLSMSGQEYKKDGDYSL